MTKSSLTIWSRITTKLQMTIPQKLEIEALSFFIITFQRDGSQAFDKEIPVKLARDFQKDIYLKEANEEFIIITLLM